jgi:hypothetical protein
VKLLVAGVRGSFPRKDAGSPRTLSGTRATEDAVEGASSAALRHSGFCARSSYPQEAPTIRRGQSAIFASKIAARQLRLISTGMYSSGG